MMNPKGWDETATGPTDAESAVRAAVSHTPGPWRVIGDTDILALEGTPSSIVVASTKFFEGPSTTWERANARLVASVPDLLEAGDDLLDALLTAAPSSCYPRIVQDAMNAWIDARKKATGRA